MFIKDTIINSENEDFTLLFCQFLDDFYRDDNKIILIKDEPPYKEKMESELCMLAAAVHKLSNDYKLTVPDWVFEEKYISKQKLYAFNTLNTEFQKHLTATSPIEYSQRNLFYGDTVLRRV